MQIRLNPFNVPDYVIQYTPAQARQDGFHLSPKYPLREVDAETLSDMCDEFRRCVFKKAEKRDPAKKMKS